MEISHPIREIDKAKQIMDSEQTVPEQEPAVEGGEELQDVEKVLVNENTNVNVSSEGGSSIMDGDLSKELSELKVS